MSYRSQLLRSRCAQWLQAGRCVALGCLMVAMAMVTIPKTSAAKPAGTDESPAADTSDDATADDAKPKKARTSASTKSSKSAPSAGSSKSKTAKSTNTARPAGKAKLSYAFKEGERYVYEVEIVVDLGDSTRTIAGHSTYTVKRADEDEAVLEHDGTLTTRSQSQGGRARFDPRHRAAMSSIPTTFGGRGELTVSTSGAVIKNTSNGTQLPFLLGPLSTLILEPLSPDNEPTWKVSNNLAVVGKSSPPKNVGPASRARSRMARQSGQPERPAFASGATEEAKYSRSAAKGNLVRIKKHLELKTEAASEEVPAMEKTSEGEITFDVQAGVPKKAVFKEVLRVAAASAPLTVTYRLLSDAEVAKLEQEASDRKAEREAKEAEEKRPLDDADVKALLAELKVPAEARGAADRLAKGPANDQREQVAKALGKLLSDKDDGTRTSAAKALIVWGTSDNVPALIKALQSDNVFLRGEAIKALGAQQDKRGAEAVAKQLPNDRHNAGEALAAMGDIAEPYVVPLLQDLDEGVRSEACKILAKIGTDKSRPALEVLAGRTRGFDAGEAKKALKQIASRE